MKARIRWHWTGWRLFTTGPKYFYFFKSLLQKECVLLYLIVGRANNGCHIHCVMLLIDYTKPHAMTVSYKYHTTTSWQQEYISLSQNGKCFSRGQYLSLRWVCFLLNLLIKYPCKIYLNVIYNIIISNLVLISSYMH